MHRFLFFVHFFKLLLQNFPIRAKWVSRCTKQKTLHEDHKILNCRESYPMKITQMMVKFIYYVKHSSLQKGVFRHKIVKTLRKGINHPPRCKLKAKRHLFYVAVSFGTCRQRNREKIGKTDTQKDKLPCLTTTESFSLLPLPLLQTRCQTLALT